MKIAAITVTYNDGYKLEEWYQYYSEYKKDLFLHIIVDNNSEKTYLSKVKDKFTDSIIIKRESNGGGTKAYNDGIRYAMNNSDVDAIMLVGNDIRFNEGMTRELYGLLNSNDDFGMVEPIILSKDSTIIEDFGSDVSQSLKMVPYGLGLDVNNIKPEVRIVDAVAGGMNLATINFYKEVGLQDEVLFMYSDEIDMAIRAKEKGFKMAVSSSVRAWHNHINPKQSDKRLPYSDFLKGRNKIYLAHKHFGVVKVLHVFITHFYLFMRRFLKSLINNKPLKPDFYFLFGTLCGLLNIRKNFKFIIN